MRRRSLLLFLAAILLVTAGPLLYGLNKFSGVKARSALSLPYARVGDRIVFKVIVKAAKNVDLEVPDAKSALSAFDIISDGVAQKESLWGQNITRWYTLAQYSPGEYTIPKVAIKYRKEDGSSGSVETNEARLKVRSVLSSDSRGDFKARLGGGMVSDSAKISEGGGSGSREIDVPIRLKILEAGGPLNVIIYSDLGVICTSVLGALLAVLLILRLLKRREPRPPALSPYETAVKELERLESVERLRDDAVKEAYSGIASALRRFIRVVHNIGDTELTTKEFLQEIDRAANIGKEQKPDIERLILLCDLVKFSGYAPAAGELKSSFENTRKIIDALHSAELPKEV